MAAPVVHFEVNAPDRKVTAEFFSKLFGWKVEDNEEMKYGLVDTYAGKGIGGGFASTEAGSKFASFYVAVDDLQATLDKVSKSGGKTIVPITPIPNVVTFAVFSDPWDNYIGIVGNEPPSDPNAKQGVSEGNNPPVGWFEIMVGDANKGWDFYGDLFGWKIKKTPPESPFAYGEVEAGEGGIPGGIGSAPEAPPATTVYAEVDDVAGYASKAETLGGKTIMPATKMEGVEFAVIADPQGNSFGLFKTLPR